MKIFASYPMKLIVFSMGICFRIETDGSLSEQGSRIPVAGGREMGY
jgi:hypothetical protein